MKKSCYIAGPMRNCKLFNFPAFDEAADKLRNLGFEVVNPAEIDRAQGFDPAKHDLSFFPDFSKVIQRDLQAVMDTDCTVLLPGWEKSTGAQAEMALARWAGKEIFLYPLLENLEEAEWRFHNEVKDATICKPTNPKDLIGSDKIPLHLWPSTATALGSLAMLDGALKYGRSNFRAIGVRASIYKDACDRHVARWFEGEDNDPDSGLPHLAHALACLAIIIDAQAAGKLNDDRMYEGGYENLLKELTPHVARLKQLHADRQPTHYTK